MRRFPLAFLLVGAMSLLAAGGAVLGAFEAPTGYDLAVHNGAGETLLATRVAGSYTSNQLSGTIVKFVFTAPDHVAEEAVAPSGKVEARRRLTGPQASAVLGPVRGLLSIRTFFPRGNYFENVEPARDLVPPSQRAAVTGTYRTRVQLGGGYVVGVFLRVEATDGSQHIADTVDYRLSSVDGWARSH